MRVLPKPRRAKTKRTPRRIKSRDTSNPFGLGFPYGGLNVGGIVNPMSGLGGRTDKNEGVFYEPTRVTTRTELEILYAQSWAAKAFIDIPVDDMMIRWREFEDMSESSIELMEEQELKFQAVDRLSRAMKAGRLYGTGLLVIMTKEADMREPFNIRRMRPGDLLNILPVDRFDCWVTKRDHNPYSKTYESAIEYGINLKSGGTLMVHASRVLRFDGQKPLSMTGWYNYEQDWGVSEIIPILKSIHQEDSIAAASGHLAQEASIPVIKVNGYEDAISGGPEGEDMTVSQKAEAISIAKGVFRTMYMDKEDDFERVEVTFSGWADMMDRHAKRLAAAAGIPATRFWGQSPLGLNATGEGDMENYALHVHAMQKRMLTDPLYKLDKVMARNAGISEPVKYTFPSLIDMSDEAQAEIMSKKMAAVVSGVAGGIITENEARNVLDGDPVVGNLEEIDESMLMPEDPDMAAEIINGESPDETGQKVGDSKPWYKRMWAKVFDGPHGSVETDSGIMFRPPSGARSNAKKVLKWKEKHGSEVKGMTQVGWTRANQLAKGELLSPRTVARMAAFERHRKNSKIDPKYKSEPWKDRGYVAWLGWGGDSGIAWAKRANAWYKERNK